MRRQRAEEQQRQEQLRGAFIFDQRGEIDVPATTQNLARIDPAAAMKIQEQIAQGQIKIQEQAAEHQRKEREHQQRMKQDAEAFVRDQRRKDAGAFADIERAKEQAANQPKPAAAE